VEEEEEIKRGDDEYSRQVQESFFILREEE
jgi:hypothetical protein